MGAMMLENHFNRALSGDGTSAAEWQNSGLFRDMPLIEVSQLAGPSQRVIIVAPHPDDEILGCGGLIQMLIAQGSIVVLVAVTDGDASHPGSIEWRPQRLARERPRETALALQQLGLSNIRVDRLSIPDGKVFAKSSHLREKLNFLVSSKDVIITTWRWDGHPDHEATGHACAEVAASCGATLIETPIWGWHWADPEADHFPKKRAHRLALSAQILDRKRLAVHSFTSQLKPDRSNQSQAILPSHVLERLLHPYEVYFI